MSHSAAAGQAKKAPNYSNAGLHSCGLRFGTNRAPTKCWGAHASGVWFPASRRKHHPANFFAPEILELCVTEVRARRPNSHAGRVHSPFLFRFSG